MYKIKQKENFIEMQIEDFTEQEEINKGKAYDVRLAILDNIEKFVQNKEERVDVINQMFKNIDSYKNMDKNTIAKTVEKFVDVSRKEKEKFASEEKNSNPETNAPVISAPVASSPPVNDTTTKISKLSNDIDSLYTQLSTIKNNANSLANASVSVAKATTSVSPKTIETFIDGFEPYTRSYASYTQI
jgi:hypothetical protein